MKKYIKALSYITVYPRSIQGNGKESWIFECLSNTALHRTEMRYTGLTFHMKCMRTLYVNQDVNFFLTLSELLSDSNNASFLFIILLI